MQRLTAGSPCTKAGSSGHARLAPQASCTTDYYASSPRKHPRHGQQHRARLRCAITWCNCDLKHCDVRAKLLRNRRLVRYVKRHAPPAIRQLHSMCARQGRKRNTGQLCLRVMISTALIHRRLITVTSAQSVSISTLTWRNWPNLMSAARFNM